MPTKACPACGTKYIIKVFSMRGTNKIKCACGESVKIKGVVRGFKRIEK
jgi:DNA-directed RNA polymerase subunit RPC12/RpoP